MDKDFWKKLEALLLAALELRDEERPSFLDQHCGNDFALRNELEEMLAAHESEVPLAMERKLLVETAPAPTQMIGTRIGPYLVESLLGEGGMGTVYLASRNDAHYHQTVALKIVRPGIQTAETLMRFRMERQVLASLTHPNIAQLLDGGMTADGRPYLVMQYIKGTPITRFCEQRDIPISERLKLFCTVCAAVQHAHRNLIVHRDLKPSNILVTEDGEVKLLDFGIAKLLNPENMGLPFSATRSGVRLMTPDYAAPEQIKSEVITTATDVYALGVLLYELLTGRSPYRIEKKIQHEVERVICEEEPVRPSTAVSERRTPPTAGEAEPATLFEWDRQQPDARLKRLLQGDLDNIVLMALRKEPERRYSSAENFASDIERYLRGWPVAAQKASLHYRFRKFIHRNKISVAAAVGVFVLAFVFGWITLSQMAHIAHQAEEIVNERDKTETEAEKTKLTSLFLEDLFESADMKIIQEGNRNIHRLRRVLHNQLRKINQKQNIDPVLRAHMLKDLGKAYKQFGDREQAMKVFNQALPLTGFSAGGDQIKHVETADILVELSNIFVESEQPDTAEALLHIVLAFLQTDHANDHERLGEAALVLGKMYMKHGLSTEAAHTFREAARHFMLRFGIDHRSVAESMENQARALVMVDSLPEAEAVLTESIRIYRKTLGNSSRAVARNLSNWGQLLTRMSRHEASIDVYRQALDAAGVAFGSHHQQVIRNHNDLAFAYIRQGNLENAEMLLRRVIQLRIDRNGSTHATVAIGLFNLGKLLIEQKKYQEAESTLGDALDMLYQVAEYAEFNPYIAEVKAVLAELHARTG